MIVLGISALYHDSAACLVIDGKIIAAAQEERFTRKKHDLNMPVNSIRFCLNKANISPEDIDVVAYYDNPIYTLDRFLKNILAAGKDSKDIIEGSFGSIFSKKLWVHNEINNILGVEKNVIACEHHVSHAASAFYPSPFNDAVIITIDGVGEWATTTIGIGKGAEIEIKEEIRYPHSLGLLYSAFTYFCGFKVNSGDYKFMGLAPYGKPIYEQIIREKLIDIRDDGSFRLNLDYFDFQYGRAMVNDKLSQLFHGPRRLPEAVITEREMDIAASVQKITEDIILRIVKHAKKVWGTDICNLVLAGGVALNCVANGKIKNANIFDNIWIQPAAGDAGGSIGCALYVEYQKGNLKRNVNPYDSMSGAYLGNEYTPEEVYMFLDDNCISYHKFEDEDFLYEQIANLLSEDKVIGLFHGRMEFGPRALGNRSIIANPQSKEMQVKLNQKIKFRESFRPFAPSVLLEDAPMYFELDGDSPYMLLCEQVCEDRRLRTNVYEDLKKNQFNMLKIVEQERSDIPAVTHVDYSARIQTVTEEKNPYYYNVLKAFKRKTGCSVIVNTSFNVRGEPIVCTLEDAYNCFMHTNMDILVLENCILYKTEQPVTEDQDSWIAKFELD